MNCPVRIAELNNDIAQHKSEWRTQYTRSAKRMDVFGKADDIISGKPTGVTRHDLPYTYEGANSVLDDLTNHPLFAKAIQCACEHRKLMDNGEQVTIADLTIRVARRAVAVAMFGEHEADLLGFAE